MNTANLIKKASNLVQIGQLQEGLNTFQRVLEQDPENIAALSGSGVVEFLLGNNETAIKLFQNAHAQASNDNQIISNLGQAYIASGKMSAAKNAFEEAYKINNQDPEICYWLGYLSEQDGKNKIAENFYKAALEFDPSHRQSYLQLANVLKLQNKKTEALAVMLNAESMFLGDHDITYVRGKLASDAVPGWHLPMIKDQERNDAYEQAINTQIKPDDIVLDIGTGSGLLAMMAARAGAKHVYACEADPVLAALAKEIIIRNGFQDQITIIEKHSTKLIIGEDIPQKVDVLVTEIFDSAIVGEGVLPTMRHAWKNLLTDNARVIPEEATLYGALIECPQQQCLNNAETINGFDLTPMNIIFQPFKHKDAQPYFGTADNGRILSEDFKIKDLNFNFSPELGFETECSALIKKGGEADSILLWFKLQLAPGITYSSKSFKEGHHWYPVTQTLLEKAPCEPHQKAILSTQFETYFDFTVKTK